MPRVILAAVLAALLAGGAFLYLHRPAAPPAAPAPPPAAPSGPRYPLAAGPAAAAQTATDDDGALGEALAALAGATALPPVFEPHQLVRRLVATVDNLGRSELPAAVRLWRPAPGAFATDGDDTAPVIAARNAERYARAFEFLRHTDDDAIVALYRREYPLLQRAYEDLGYPGHYFNDRVVEVIDLLLATPEPTPPLALVRPSVAYRYADPALEHLAAGQKALLRLGPAGEREVKARLRTLRARLVTPA